MSGRPEKPIAADIPGPVRELATRLRERRAATGMTLAELGAHARCSPATITRVLAGRQVPRWQLVEDFARATRATPQQTIELRKLWATAKAAYRAGTPEGATASDELPPGVSEVLASAYREAHQRVVLRDLYNAAGMPTVRDVAERTELSRSAVHRVLAGQSTAGADVVARTLTRFISSRQRDRWERTIGEVFGESAPSSQAPLYQAGPATRSEADRAFAEFLSSLRHVRNLIAHGQVEVDPHFAAHVMELAALVRNDRRRPAFGGTEPEEPGPQAAPLLTVEPHSVVDAPDGEPAVENRASEPTSGGRGGA